MTTQEFIQSKHFRTNQTISGYYQLLWKDDIMVDDPAGESFYDKDLATDVFNDIINEQDTWTTYFLHYFDKEECEIHMKCISAYDDDEALDYARKILAEDNMGTTHIEVYDWQFNYVNDID